MEEDGNSYYVGAILVSTMSLKEAKHGKSTLVTSGCGGWEAKVNNDYLGREFPLIDYKD